MVRGTRYLVAQPNGLGDVVHTLPMAALIKRHFPKAEVLFASRLYAQPVVMACEHVDRFIDFERISHNLRELKALHCDVLLNPSIDKTLAATAHKIGITERVGNFRRVATWSDCNRFTYYGRNSSGHHEAQSNLKELRALGIRSLPCRTQILSMYGLTRIEPLAEIWRRHLEDPRFHLILHTQSRGHGREWPLQHYLELARGLPADRFKIYLSGIEKDGERLRAQCPELLALPQVVDIVGHMSLSEFISFIAAADGLVAGSTGPLHLAAATGIHALGLFPPRKTIDIVRWGALGTRAESLSLPQNCQPSASTCPKYMNDGGGPCRCMFKILPSSVAERIERWDALKRAGCPQIQ